MPVGRNVSLSVCYVLAHKIRITPVILKVKRQLLICYIISKIAMVIVFDLVVVC